MMPVAPNRISNTPGVPATVSATPAMIMTTVPDSETNAARMIGVKARPSGIGLGSRAFEAGPDPPTWTNGPWIWLSDGAFEIINPIPTAAEGMPVPPSPVNTTPAWMFLSGLLKASTKHAEPTPSAPTPPKAGVVRPVRRPKEPVASDAHGASSQLEIMSNACGTSGYGARHRRPAIFGWWS